MEAEERARKLEEERLQKVRLKIVMTINLYYIMSTVFGNIRECEV